MNNLIFIWIMNEILHDGWNIEKTIQSMTIWWRMEFWKGKSHNEWKVRELNLQNGQKWGEKIENLMKFGKNGYIMNKNL